MATYIKLLRVRQWIKNGFIFLPLFFGLKLFDGSLFKIVLTGSLAFSLMCSSIYIINDITDLEFDKTHPYKCKRPIAAGVVSIRKVGLLAILLMACNIFILYSICPRPYLLRVFGISLLYFILNIAYSVLRWKNVPLIDICILASGFIIRIFFGALLANAQVSTWLYLVVIFGAFYLGLAKRRGELTISDNAKKRKVLQFYTYNFLDKNMYMSLTITIVFYALWCSENIQYRGLLWSIPLLILIVLRYNYLIENENSSSDPMEIIVKDWVLVILGLCFLGYLSITIYLGRPT